MNQATYFDKIKRGPIAGKCAACAVEWVEHSSISATCAALHTAIDCLRGIAETPRNRQARAKAMACVLFLETQIPELRK